MLNRTILWTAGCLAAVGMVGIAGCDKHGGAKAPSEVDPQAVVGTWLETREASAGERSNIRQAKVEWESDDIRQITFNADNTFKLIVCKPSGTPLDASKAIEGTWKVDGNTVTFAVTKNTLTGVYKNWTPLRFFGPFEAGGTTECTIHHENGEDATYKRQG